MSEILGRFDRFIKDDVYDKISNNYIVLEEKNEQVQYSVKLILPQNQIKNYRHIRLDYIKNPKVSNYLKEVPTKDCDDILINLKKKQLFLIELKKPAARRAVSNGELKEKMKHSLKWVEHLFYMCNNNQNELDSWEIFELVLVYNEKIRMPDFRNLDKLKHSPITRLDNGIIQCIGCSYPLESLLTCC